MKEITVSSERVIEQIPLPNKKYQIIYADPPYSFSSKELQKYGGVRFTSINKHYSTLHKDYIKGLPINNSR